MKHFALLSPISLLAIIAWLVFSAQPGAVAGADAAGFWPQWRGPAANGFSATAQPPLEWSETNHVKWKTPMRGAGDASPIVWGDRVFLLSAEPADGKTQPLARGEKPSGEYSFLVICLDRAAGKVVWEKVARKVVPHEGHNPEHGFASASAATDGQCLLAYFGSRGLHCYDLEGDLKWSKDLGRMRTRNAFGEAASPALCGNTVVVSWDDEDDNDFITAFDKNNGQELWRTKRDEATGWSTPLPVVYAGATQVVVNASGKVRSYDLANGRELWSCAGQTANAIPSPVASADTVFVTSGFRGNALLAIALGKSGDLTGTDAIRWSHAKNTPYVPSPLLAGDFLYVHSGNNGVLSCFHAQTGKVHYEGQRLEGITGIYASPVAAGDRVYVLGRNGLCLVLKNGPALEVLARNKIDDKTDASIALAGKELFIRGQRALYCIAEP